MLAQFQARYPTGTLISELLTIYQGKFVVRVAVQIDGVTRATGMAAAETPEEAEDKARSRAIAIVANEPSISLPAESLPAATATQPAVGVMPEPPLPKAFLPESAQQYPNQSHLLTTSEPVPRNDASIFPMPISEPEPSLLEGLGSKDKTKPLPVTSNQLALEEDTFEDFGMFSAPEIESSGSPTLASSNITPVILPSHDSQEKAGGQTATQISEPIDLSDVIAKTDVELERIGWSKKDGKDYLLRSYGKPGRTLLTEQELLEFLSYLESQPAKHKWTK